MLIERGSLEVLFKLKENKCNTLKNIVVLDPITEEDKAKGREIGLEVYHY